MTTKRGRKLYLLRCQNVYRPTLLGLYTELKIAFLSNISIRYLFWNPVAGWIGQCGGPDLARWPPVERWLSNSHQNSLRSPVCQICLCPRDSFMSGGFKMCGHHQGVEPAHCAALLCDWLRGLALCALWQGLSGPVPQLLVKCDRAEGWGNSGQGEDGTDGRFHLLRIWHWKKPNPATCWRIYFRSVWRSLFFFFTPRIYFCSKLFIFFSK